MSKDKDGFNVRYSNRDIIEKLDSIVKRSDSIDTEHEKILTEILNHAKLTNGRVSRLELKSFGIWVSENPIKFMFIVLTIMTILGLSAADIVSALI